MAIPSARYELIDSLPTRGQHVTFNFISNLLYLDAVKLESFRAFYEKAMPKELDYNSFLSTLGVYRDSVKAALFIFEFIRQNPAQYEERSLEEVINIASSEYLQKTGKSLHLMLYRFNESVIEPYLPLVEKLSEEVNANPLQSPLDQYVASKTVSALHMERLAKEKGTEALSAKIDMPVPIATVFFEILHKDVEAGVLSKEDFDQYLLN